MKKFYEFINENIGDKNALVDILKEFGIQDPFDFIAFLEEYGYSIVELDPVGRTTESFDNFYNEEDWYNLDEYDDIVENFSEEVKDIDNLLEGLFKNNYILINEDGSTTASPGSGTAVGGGAGSGDSGSFTSAMGVSVSGGDSGSAFSTNSNVSGMGPVISPQPSSTPGDVRNGIKGSGDISKPLSVYGKTAGGKKNKKNKKKSKNNKTATKIDNLYVTNYKEGISNGKTIQSWKVFNENKK